MTEIITGLLGQISDGERVRTYLFTTAPYHDPALASLIEYGTALAVIPKNAGMSISEEVEFQPQGGGSNVSISQVPLINTEGEFDNWGGWILAGLDWTWGRGYADQPWENWFKAYFKGSGKPEFRGRERVMITLHNWFDYMSQPVARQVFSEEDVSNTRLINTTVPLVFGSANQVKPLVTEPQIQRYAVAGNANDIPAVQAGGNPTTPVYEVVPLGFQLFQGPSLQITCDVTGPPVEGWEENDALAAIGDFPSWSGGLPATDEWEVTEDAPYSVISETAEGYARVEATAQIDGDTGWQTGTTYTVRDDQQSQFVPVPGTDSLADVLAADDGTYARLQASDYAIYRMNGTGFTFGLTEDVGPVKIDGRVVIEDAGDGDPALYFFYLQYPDGTTRNLLGAGIVTVPGTKTALEFTINNAPPGNPYRLTNEILEDPAFGVVVGVKRTTPGQTDVRVHQVALKVHYGPIIDRLRLTTADDVLTVGNRYLLRVYHRGASGDSIAGYWGTVAQHSDPIPGSDNPFTQTNAQFTGEGEFEAMITATGPRFAIELDRGEGGANGEQSIERIELIDKSGFRKSFLELQRYNHELFDKDPDEVCDNDALELVQTQAGNPSLGWYVDDQTTGEQLSTLWAHSLGAAAWGGLDKKWTAGQMRVPQQPDGEYLSVVGSFGPGSAYPDTGADLRDRVYAARNVHPLRDSETAGVTSTWTEDQRQLVLDKWRITEKADWSNLVGYPTLTVTSIDPAVGDTAGGTAVTITGTGFGAGATVTIGGNAATNVTVVSATEIACVTPSGTAGTVDVVVSVGGERATLSGGFEYQEIAWTPGDMSPAFRFENQPANFQTLSGDITQWDDLSANQWHVASPSAASRPAIVSGELNSRPVARGDGSESLAFPSSAMGLFRNASAGWIAAVYRKPSGSEDNRVVVSFDTGSGNATRLQLGSGFSGYDGPFFGGRRLDSDSFSAAVGGSELYDQWVIAIGTVDWQNRTLRLFVNGNLEAENTSAFGSGGTSEDVDSGSANLFAQGSTINELQGDIAMAFGDSTALSESDREKLEGYIAHELGLSGNLPSGHPYKSSPP